MDVAGPRRIPHVSSSRRTCAEIARLAAIVLLAGVLGGWVVLVHRLSSEPLGVASLSPAGDPRPTAVSPVARVDAQDAPFPFSSNDDCYSCHREIFEEWFEDQHALSWFNEPLLPQDPKMTECSSCHAPQPILETGLASLPRTRVARFHEGVGCIECHLNGDHVEGPGVSATAPCRPRFEPLFSESTICKPCHAPHGSFEEWRTSGWARRGYTCQSCHMPLIDAPSVTGAPPRRRRSHRLASQRTPDFLADSLRLEAQRSHDGRLEVAVTNSGAGHNVPGEIFNRELFLATVVRDRQGAIVEEYRESFRTPRRDQRASVPSTQLRPDERRAFLYEVPRQHAAIHVTLGYKFFFFLPDGESLVVDELEIVMEGAE